MSTVAGGASNTAPNVISTIGGGFSNTASGYVSTIAGGYINLASGGASTIAGGQFNVASQSFATVPGGANNAAAGAYSLAAGRRAKAMSAGCFTWGDSTDADITCAVENAFVVRASGGFVIGTNAAMTAGCSIAPGGGAWSCTSSRDAKVGFDAVDNGDVLVKVTALPISTWRYKGDITESKHIGPVAEDFREAFQLGDSDKSIGVLDASGVALAAIQGLNAKLEQKIAIQERKIGDLRKQYEEEIADLRRVVQHLMARTVSAHAAK
jgi:hypothetical protein